MGIGVRRVVGWICCYMAVIGCVAAIAVGQTVQPAQQQQQQTGTSRSEEQTIVIGENMALSLTGVVVLVGVVGAWWTLRQAIAEQRIRMDAHTVDASHHHTVDQLRDVFLPKSEYTIAHQAVIDGMSRIERMLCEMRKELT